MRNNAHKIMNIILGRWKLVISITVLATFVLILFLGKGQDVWFDENYSIIIAKKPVAELIRLTGVDAHPPLFYLLLKVWGSIFGWSELSLRTMSAFLSAATIGILVFLIRTLFTVRIALMAMPFLVLSPFWLRYGYEIRMYALAGLIAALGTFFLAKAVSAKNEAKWWLFYATALAVGLYTLYLIIVVWLAHVVWLMVYHRKKLLQQQWLWAYAGAFLLFLPYLPTVVFQLTHSALPGIGWTLNLTHMWELASRVLIYTPEWSVSSWAALGIMIFVVLTVFLIDRSRQYLDSRERKSLSLFISLATVPFLFFVLISLPMSQPFFVPRYLAHVSLFIYALFGLAFAIGWSKSNRKAAAIQGLIAFLLLFWGIGQLVHAGNFNYERMQRPQTVNIRQNINCEKELVVSDDPYTYIDNNYYFGGCETRFYSPEPIKPWGGYAPLVGHKDLLAASQQLQARTVVHVYWNDRPKAFLIDGRYRFVSSVIFDKQVADTYELISE